jgi:hypothetical protein
VADFVKLAATAQRLITANGRQVTIAKFGSSPADDSKPWRGRREYHEAEVTGYAAFVPGSMLRSMIARDDQGVLREGEYALFAADDDDGYDLRDFDAIEDGGKTWKIKSVELIAPASTRVLYMIEVER